MPTISSSRQFRKGRVLHNSDTDFVLVNSPTPRQWQGVFIDATLGIVELRTYDSRQLQLSYQKWSGGVRDPMRGPDLAALVVQMQAQFNLSDVEWRVRYALRTKASPVNIPGASPVPPLSAANATPGTTAYQQTADEDEDDAPAAKKAAAGKRAIARATAFSVPTPNPDSYWYEADRDRKLTRDFIALRQSGFTVNLMIAGPSGAGKTVGVQKLGEELGYPVHIVNCQAITTPEKWIGQMMADTGKGTYFVPSQHLQWVERTHEDCENSEWCILLYDEITRLRPELNNMTYSLFDTQKGLEVPQMGRRVHMNERNIIISTANIGAAFAGTFGQDRAFRERFAMTMERDFPPVDEEVKILTSATGIRENLARQMAVIAEATRDKWRNQVIDQPISTRTLNTWALLVSGGYDLMQAAEYTLLPLYSEDGGVESDRAKVRLEIEAKMR